MLLGFPYQGGTLLRVKKTCHGVIVAQTWLKIYSIHSIHCKCVSWIFSIFLEQLHSITLLTIGLNNGYFPRRFLLQVILHKTKVVIGGHYKSYIMLKVILWSFNQLAGKICKARISSQAIASLTGNWLKGKWRDELKNWLANRNIKKYFQKLSI